MRGTYKFVFLGFLMSKKELRKDKLKTEWDKLEHQSNRLTKYGAGTYRKTTKKRNNIT